MNQVLIDDEFWFYINNMDDINNFNVYIDIFARSFDNYYSDNFSHY